MPDRKSRSKPAASPVIVVDTREQRPWDFGPDVATVRACLPAGDYALQGHETEFVVERKSLDDYVGTVIRDQDRFARELVKLWAYQRRWVIVEASFGDVENRNYHGEVHPAAILGKTYSLCVDWAVPVIFAGTTPGNVEQSRARAAKLALGLLLRCWRIGCAESPEYRGEDFGIGEKGGVE